MKLLKHYAYGGPTPLEKSKVKLGVDSSLDALAGFSKTGGQISSFGNIAGSLFNKESQSGSIAGSAIQYGSKGADIGSMFGPYGTAIGAGVGLVGGAIVGDINYDQMQKKKEEERKRAYNQNTEVGYNNFKAQSASGFPISGVGAVPMYAFGGNIKDSQAQYKAEGGEVITHNPNNPPMVNPAQGEANPLSSTTTALEGDSHNNASGGISVAQGDYVFSDRLIVTDSIKRSFKDILGSAIGKVTTFADVAKALGKLEAKAEEKAKSYNGAESNTGKLTLEKITQFKQNLANEQESLNTINNINSIPSFAFGGNVKKFSVPGQVDPEFGPASFINTKPNQLENTTNSISKNSFSMPSTEQINSAITGIGNAINKGGTALNQNLDKALTGAMYAANTQAINKLPLEQEQYPKRNFIGLDVTDRSNEARFNNQAAFTAALNATRSNNASANNTNIQNLLATTQRQNNSINTQEALRQDNLKMTNLNRADQVEAFNVSQENARFGDRQSNTAMQLGERLKNNNFLAQSLVAQKEQADLKAISQLNTKLIAAKYQSGVAARSAPAAEVLENAGMSKEEIANLDVESKERLKQLFINKTFSK